ncbi:hypothetical protein [Streptomyces sp. NPDC056061]|uniref:hypothetical protein n=1 Tax=Streptomyces sp. NPDC056061 TaxID=3345700 RepID=UPI0035DD920A
MSGAAVTAVALYAVVPVPGAEDLVPAPLASHAESRGWVVPAGCAVTDAGPLDQETGLRTGWTRIRDTACAGRINGIVVPALAHIAYHWNDWTVEQSWLSRRGLFVIATDPTDQAVLPEPQGSRP